MVGRRKERQRKLGRSSEGKKQRQLQSVCEGEGRCAPGRSARVREVLSRCKGVRRNPCCTVRRL
eukprot:3446903-Rhodomonas_salina.1